VNHFHDQAMGIVQSVSISGVILTAHHASVKTFSLCHCTIAHHERLSSEQVWRWSCNSTRRFWFCQRVTALSQLNMIKKE